MKVTFIRPNFSDRRSPDAMQPLAFAVLAGLTPSQVELDLYDERIEEIPANLTTDLIALSVETFTARRAYQIADHYRKRGIPIVMGGYHPTFMPDEALEHADSVVIGEAEGLWPLLLEDFQRGELKKGYHQKEKISLEQVKYDRSIFKGKKYASVLPVQFNRGCKFACEFCSVSAFLGKPRYRPVTEVVLEIKESKKKNILIVDDNIFTDEEKAKELFTALIPLKIKWGCQISIDIVNNEELLELMQKSGCIAAMIGFESLDPKNLALMKKGSNLKHIDYTKAVNKLKKYGIMVYGSFVFGYDEDTVETFKASVEFAIDSKFFLANFNTLMPMPGTGLYQRLDEEGRLLNKRWWIDENFSYGDVVYKPGRLTPEALNKGCFYARLKFHEYGQIFKRALEPKSNCRTLINLGIFLAGNLIARKEILKKAKVID